MLLETIHVYAVLQTCNFLNRHIELYAIHFSSFFIIPLKATQINFNKCSD